MTRRSTARRCGQCGNGRSAGRSLIRTGDALLSVGCHDNEMRRNGVQIERRVGWRDKQLAQSVPSRCHSQPRSTLVAGRRS